MISLAQIKAQEWFLLRNKRYDIVATIEDDASHMWLYLGNGYDCYTRVYGARTDIKTDEDITDLDMKATHRQATELIDEYLIQQRLRMIWSRK
ncbi:MAG: hypothetical protein AAF442_04845 [Pseudomonadota bacterium]